MRESFGARLQHAWNAFNNKDTTRPNHDYGNSYGSRPDRVRLRYGNEKSIVASIYTRIAIDVAAIMIQHVKTDQNGRFVRAMDSGLNDCLTLSANKDQTGRAFMQDVVMSMFDEGCVAIVPVDTTLDPKISGSYEINSLRTAKVIQWYPDAVRLKLYNDRTGQKEEITMPKSTVAIIENPLYSVMNEPNSTLKRLIHKLNLLDAIDEQSGSGKLDVIIQLPYVVKSQTRKDQAEQRRKDIEMQLAGSKYGIAYIDGTERVTQLNRPAENNLMTQIEYLTRMLYSQLGMTESIFDGTADEKTMINYHNRTVEPVIAAIADGMKRTFLTKTARTQGQTIMFFRDPFKLVPVTQLADIADKFTRNEIMSSNEVRAIIGYKPSDDPAADELRNKNLNQQADPAVPPEGADPTMGEEPVVDPMQDLELV